MWPVSLAVSLLHMALWQRGIEFGIDPVTVPTSATTKKEN